MKKNKHILVISQYFYPEQFRINDICAEWVKRGYKVTVLTGIPNYPMGKFFEGYGYCKKRKEIWNGIEIVRIPLIPRGKTSIGMVLNYISFVVSGAVWKCISDIKADYVFSFEVSPMTQVLIGCWYAKKHRIPHYLYVQDLWPENVITVTGISSPIVIKPINRMVDYIYKNCDQIFATSPSFVDSICDREAKVNRDKVHYWPQYAESFYEPKQKECIKELNDDKSFKVIFTGNIGIAQGLDILPNTAKLLKDENIKFVIVGDGRYLDEFKREIKENNVQNKFIMIPRQPAEKIPYFLSACDAAFISFKKDKLWEKTIPAKLQSYMACGMPVIASANGETKRIIQEAQCGMCCSIGNPIELKDIILKMEELNLDKMKKNSRDYYLNNFQKDSLLDTFDKWFD